jgi:hypothetical protein
MLRLEESYVFTCEMTVDIIRRDAAFMDHNGGYVLVRWRRRKDTLFDKLPHGRMSMKEFDNLQRYGWEHIQGYPTQIQIRCV